MIKIDKSKSRVPFAKIYLAGPWFNIKQKVRTGKAIDYLSANDTVALVHMPFDTQYKDATVDDPKEGLFGSLEWQVATATNDDSAMATSDCTVVLYDLDNEDVGTAAEIGFMHAFHKPIIFIGFHDKPLKEYELNLMLARYGTVFLDGNVEFDSLKDYDFNHFPSSPVSPFPVF